VKLLQKFAPSGVLISFCKAPSIAEMNMDLDLNPTDFQLCDGFGFYKFCLTGFGLDLDLIILV